MLSEGLFRMVLPKPDFSLGESVAERQEVQGLKLVQLPEDFSEEEVGLVLLTLKQFQSRYLWVHLRHQAYPLLLDFLGVGLSLCHSLAISYQDYATWP